MDKLASAKVLVQLSLRSIVSHKAKSLIVGGILMFGTFLLVLGTTMLTNVEKSMREAITGALIGDMQVHSDKAKDELAFFGPNAGSAQDLGVIEEFGRVRAALEKVDNVSAVVPMGRDLAMLVSGGNEFDQQIEALRGLVKEGDRAKVDAQVKRVRQMADLVKADYENRAKITRDTGEVAAALETLARVTGDAFWEEFRAAPEPAFEFLDTKLAPLQSDESMVYMPYVGTDVDRFAREFSKFQIVDGEMIPSGQRGLLFNKKYYDQATKNRIAWELDNLQRELVKGGKLIAATPELQEKIRKIGRQAKRLQLELGPDDAQLLEGELRAFLPGAKGDLAALLTEFLKVDDGNFAPRYAFFYEKIAPKIRLHKVKVGELVTLRTFTRSGYSRAVNVKLWGTFQFAGLDDSPLAGGYSIADLMTFRDLYGLMTPERRKELDAIRAEVGLQDVDSDNAEAELFGGGGSLEATIDEKAVESDAAAATAAAEGAAAVAATASKSFTQEDIDRGVALTAAVLVKDPSRTRQTMSAVAEAGKAGGLGLKVVSWEQASGVIGQFILVLRGVLFVVIGIIFLVALVIINNSMLMATMDRVQEIGTMRAIGAQRSFILWMYLIETSVLGIVAAAIGAGLASAVVGLWNRTGLPATHEVLVLLFGGPRLYPTISLTDVVLGFVLIGIVSIGATLYPARLATRVAPIVAMQRRE